jgi:hypothetical protein
MASLERKRLENLAAGAMERQFDRVPRMRDFHFGEWVERDYYIRYLVETVLRIRLNNEADAYAIFKLGSRDIPLGTQLTRYLADEYGHEDMFLRDLAQFGFPAEKVDSTALFSSTAKILGYLRLATDMRGPAATTVWNWFMEWHTDQYQQRIIDGAAAKFGDECVKGLQAHADIDSQEDHDDLMFEAVSRAVGLFGSEDQAYADLELYVSTFGDYFAELHLATVH